MTESPFYIQAATVVIFRNGAGGGLPELLMLERAGSMRFAGGAAVFPGGKIDPADYDLAAELANELELDEAAARVAAVRETLEEAGLALAMNAPISAQQAADARAMLAEVGALAPVLERFGWVPDLSALHPWARWCPDWKGAFDTRFYLADIGTGAVDISKDDTENSHLFWASAADALAMADRGEISVIFPTRRNLERLALHGSFAESCSFAASYPIRTIAPQRREIDGLEHLTIPEDLGYPVTSEVMGSVKRG